MNAIPVLRLALALILWAPWLAGAATDFSVAERALFMDNHLGKLRPPLTLHYVYRKSGALEEAFDDTVNLVLTAQPDGTCCAVRAEFFSGARAVRQPEVESAQGNPAILYFLERDIREMQRLTQGQPNYFRKRIRMAVYQGASVRSVTLPYRGRPVAVREISISPYLDDPNRARFEKLANKTYVFLLSDAVPGGLYGIRTRIDAESAAAAPLMVEEMLLDGAGRQP
ncbi:MAG: hypothetical protein EOP82_07820 [Variovorax sp.]|nr:MAG: hypothetical protein EOP82_07820 [Variovorax sp.]